MNIEPYLHRINFHKSPQVSKEVLFELQRNHLLHVPFENLDIHYDRKISLEVSNIYKKIVVDKRGGFCYELNGLFFHLLKEIGFNSKLISARVYENGTYYPEFDHLAIVVHLNNEEYLVDVGFGKFSLEPLKIEMGKQINDSFGYFQFDKYDLDYFRINELKNKELAPVYIFKTKARELSEFKERCEYNQTSEHSHFTQKKLISIVNIDGRVTLNNEQLKITHSGVEKVIQFKKRDFEKKLKEYFNIEM
ncbi:N-hydroxyarylamine O-acetyltransferase [Saonia flava]|uniref:N-hydroxyarylamine O-acetyltransferase n=1 Tax=Saonia flava TaxID=523696 RepID=A0A846R2U1_9FLAO|nr:arylamine N-acetyltransferase [Saonia flava]NJB71684.1 N-hydroxyarylamine O-acetyltransferase [Saonia flava]